MGRPDHQPKRTMKGIQKSVNWMLKSMGRALASFVYITVNMVFVEMSLSMLLTGGADWPRADRMDARTK